MLSPTLRATMTSPAGRSGPDITLGPGMAVQEHLLMVPSGLLPRTSQVVFMPCSQYDLTLSIVSTTVSPRIQQELPAAMDGISLDRG